METRYRMLRRGDTYYSHDKKTGSRQSLETDCAEQAKRLVMAKNQAWEQPALNIAMAKTYLLAKSPHMVTRTWGEVMEEKAERFRREGAASTVTRWKKVTISKPFQLIKKLPLVESEPEHFLALMRHPRAGNSANKWLRILHNFALDMGWLLTPVLAKKAWPKFKVKDRRGITEAEHLRILEDAKDNQEECDYYSLLWETGGAQTDIASLLEDRVDHEQKTLLYRRMKTQAKGYEFAKIRLGIRLCEILERRPKFGPLFPHLGKMSVESRAKMFRRRCKNLEIKDVSLHCYRYSWAERARKANVPLRVSMEVLGHKSRAVHQAYAKKVEADILPLEYYEQKQAENIIDFQQHQKAV